LEVGVAQSTGSSPPPSGKCRSAPHGSLYYNPQTTACSATIQLVDWPNVSTPHWYPQKHMHAGARQRCLRKAPLLSRQERLLGQGHLCSASAMGDGAYARLKLTNSSANPAGACTPWPCNATCGRRRNTSAETEADKPPISHRRSLFRLVQLRLRLWKGLRRTAVKSKADKPLLSFHKNMNCGLMQRHLRKEPHTLVQ